MTLEERDSIDWKSLNGSDIYFLAITMDERTYIRKPLTILKCTIMNLPSPVSNIDQVIHKTINPNISIINYWTVDVYKDYYSFFLTEEAAKEAFEFEQRKYLGKLKRYRSNCERMVRKLKLKCLEYESDIEYANKILEK